MQACYGFREDVAVYRDSINVTSSGATWTDL